MGQKTIRVSNRSNSVSRGMSNFIKGAENAGSSFIRGIINGAGSKPKRSGTGAKRVRPPK